MIASIKTFPKILVHNAEKYGDSKVAIREKDYGIWQSYSWKDYLDQVRNFALGLASLGLTIAAFEQRQGGDDTERPGRLFDALGVAVEQRQARTLGGEGHGHRAAEIARGAGDQDHGILEFTHGASFRSVDGRVSAGH